MSAIHNVDVLLSVAMLGFVLYGLWQGLIRTVGSLAGVILGTVVASHFYSRIATTNTGRVIAFIALYIVMSRLVAIGFYFLEKLYNAIAVIPGMKLVNRLAGAALGFVEGAIVIGIAVHFANIFPLESVRTFLANSSLVPFFLRVGAIVAALFPAALRSIPTIGA